jgi:CBS domain-containing protein
MVGDPVTARPDATLGEFMDDVVSRTRYTTYPVTDNGRAVGLLPFRRVAEIPRGEWERRSVGDCMIPREQVPVVQADDDLIEAAGELAESDLRRGLVLDGDRLVGLLSMTDVARALQMRRPQPARTS